MFVYSVDILMQNLDFVDNIRMRKIKFGSPKVIGIGALLIVGGIGSSALLPDSPEVGQCRASHIIGDPEVYTAYENKQVLIAQGVLPEVENDTKFTFKKFDDSGKTVSFTTSEKEQCDEAYDADVNGRVGNTKVYPSLALVSVGMVTTVAGAIDILKTEKQKSQLALL